MPKDKKKSKEIPRVNFTYEKDTKRMHRFTIGAYGEDFSGTLYMPKGNKIPEKIILTKVVTE